MILNIMLEDKPKKESSGMKNQAYHSKIQLYFM